MDLKAGTWLVAPAVKNSSCSHPRYTGHVLIYHIGLTETIEALIILMLTIGVIGANALVIFVINNRRYTAYIHQQPRYLLTSLALNDLAIGLLITPFGLLPALFHCWPYGEIFCQIQGCVAILSITWIICLTVFGLLVLPKGYYFNNTGLLACEPFYSKPSYRILATCALYFPTTMVLMYSYGSSFHASRFRLDIPIPPPTTPTTIMEKMEAQERHLSGSASRTMAAISLGFIVMVTPWTIQEVVTACTGSKLPPFLDFIVTWTALSNSFWNPFLYWLLNAHFRRLSRHLLSNRWCACEDSIDLHQKTHCCNASSECDQTALPLPPGPPASRPPGHGCQIITRPDIEGLSEKYWGEILERTVSSSSLHALQKTFAQQHQQQLQQQQHQQQQQQQQTTNLSKTSELDLTIHESNEHIKKISNSEPKLCEHIYHDVNCAKSKAIYNGCHSIKGLPDI